MPPAKRERDDAATAPAADVGAAAFLRGINVSGSNVIKMAELKAVFERCGAHAVVTYIQSGNVAFRVAPAALDSFGPRVEAALRQRGINTTVMLRSHAELKAILEAAAPAVERAGGVDASGNKVHVLMFGSACVAAKDVAPPLVADKLVRGSEAFWTGPIAAPETKARDAVLWLGNGVAGCKAAAPATLARAFGVDATMRNMNTMRKMFGLLV